MSTATMRNIATETDPDALREYVATFPQPFNTLRANTTAGTPASLDTLKAEARLQHAAAIDRPETVLNRLRVLFHLSQLVDDGIVRSVIHRGHMERPYLLTARGFRGERAYTLRDLEAFIHGADAARDL